MSTPAGWYPDPSRPDAASLRYWDGAAWTSQTGPGAAPVAVPDKQRIEPWALVISVIPLIGLIGGAVSMVKGKTLTGGLMIAVGAASWLVMQLVLPALF